MYNVFQTITAATADTNSNWIFLPPSEKKTNKLIIQGYYEGAPAADATIGLYGTLNTTLASTKSMEKLIGSITTLTSASGAFTYEVDNYGYTAVRLKYLKGSLTTLGTLLIALNWER